MNSRGNWLIWEKLEEREGGIEMMQTQCTHAWNPQVSKNKIKAAYNGVNHNPNNPMVRGGTDIAIMQKLRDWVAWNIQHGIKQKRSCLNK